MVSHCDGEAGVVYFEVMCVHEGSRGGAVQAAAVCMHVSSCLDCAHCPPTHAGQAGLRMVFIAGNGAWSGSTDHPMMVRAGRAALSASRPA